MLPLSEISFETLAPKYWRIVSYAAKWVEGSPEFKGTVPVTPAKVDRPLADRIIAVARRAWESLGGEGYGRVDMRVAADGQPYVLEVNPNPDLSTDAGYACMARAEGWDYDTLVANVVNEAMDRHGGQDATRDLLRQVSA